MQPIFFLRHFGFKHLWHMESSTRATWNITTRPTHSPKYDNELCDSSGMTTCVLYWTKEIVAEPSEEYRRNVRMYNTLYGRLRCNINMIYNTAYTTQ